MAANQARDLFAKGALTEAEAVLRAALDTGTREFELLNLLGAVLQRQQRRREALAVLDEAHALSPQNVLPYLNRGNIYISLGEWEPAIAMFKLAVRLDPGNGIAHLKLGMALSRSGQVVKARRRLRIAHAISPHDVAIIIEQSWLEEQCGRSADAMQFIERGLIEEGFVPELVRSRVVLLRRGGRHREAADWLVRALKRMPFHAQLHRELALTVAHFDRQTANRIFDAALAQAPDDIDLLVDYADSLQRTRGADEALNIDKAHGLARRALAIAPHPKLIEPRVRGVLVRCADFEALTQSFAEQGEAIVQSGSQMQLLTLMSQVSSDEDRAKLLGWHKRCAQDVEAQAARSPLGAASGPRGSGKIRIGLLSGDLRDHPVGYFAWPMIKCIDRSAFEIYCYSTHVGAADTVQRMIAAHSNAFREVGRAGQRDVAAQIAADGVDIMIDIGGPTDQNKPGILAWRPAKRQASWIGYPHSTGFSAIDRIILDPYVVPSDAALMTEAPLLLASSFGAIFQPGFVQTPDVDLVPPEERRGFVTFGTMNNPYKYTTGLLETWARIVAAVPRSRFLFVRPEAGVPAFRANVSRIFEREGVSPHRIEFVAVRGSHLKHYNDIDVTLDTFPQTGGTTTAEAAWMGVPVVSLTGKAIFERLSHSVLTNSGLSDLATASLDAYVKKALAVAADTAWRAELRRHARARFRAHPIGRPMLFASELKSALLGWMDGPR